MNLYEFYTSTVYDLQPELDALKEHTNGSVLFVGNYSAAALAVHFPESFATVPDQNVLFACQTNNDADIKYAGADTDALPYPDNSFDTLVSAYNAVHKHPERLEELKRVSKQAILIIEADMGSEYVQILNEIDPQPVTDVSMLLEMLSEYSVMEQSIDSHYSFSSQEEFSEYFAAEFREHENKEIHKETIQKHYQPTVGEQATLFVCTQ